MFAGIVASVLLVLFVGCWIWAYLPGRKADFDAAAALVFEDAPAENRDPERAS